MMESAVWNFHSTAAIDLWVEWHGITAHAGQAPWEGRSALHAAEIFLIAANMMREQMEPTARLHYQILEGGLAVNVIPDYALAKVDVRIAQENEGQRIEDSFQALGRSTHTPGVRVQVLGGINRKPMVPSEKTKQQWEQIKAIGEDIGLEMTLTATGGCSDGNYTASLGIPTIDAMGVRGGCVHSEDEYIELDSIIPNLHLMCEIVKAFADGRISRHRH